MLLYSDSFYKWLFWYAFIAMLFAGHTYLANTRRPTDDPEKRNYPPILIALAPVTLSLSILVSMLVFTTRALLYGLFLIALTIGLVCTTTVNMVRGARTKY